MNATVNKMIRVAIVGLLLVPLAMLFAGCGQGKPTVLVFTGKGSKSAEEMKPIVDKLKKKYKDTVVFEVISMDDPADKGEVDKYHVSMNPTVIIMNAQGKVKETFMGKAQEEMLTMAIESYIPGKKPVSSGPSPNASYPGPPLSSSPGQVQTIPVNPPQ